MDTTIALFGKENYDEITSFLEQKGRILLFGQESLLFLVCKKKKKADKKRIFGKGKSFYINFY